MLAHRLFLASSNPDKLREYRELAGSSPIEIQLIPDFDRLSAFDETAPTFAENSAGKALHYSRFTSDYVMADDSGLVVPVLGGAPGVYSARYAGPHANDTDRTRKLLREMEEATGNERRAQFVCVITLACKSRVFAITSDFVAGLVATEPRGTSGFGYDPIFFFPALGRTFAELSPSEKNRHSHRGRAFRKVLELLSNSATLS